ncbi:unnamed protein product (macronuclear) [Paramecium tetraurelia]|uniref:B box-type domain-containing protein n=1 Tax=Paramecium tetraurelia TaxID=5888 RepID=A0BM13_PARTE|nr:uncharacterized protein GSPATT00030214001 [Paramecium tetraurelia]CAK59580.1 unnamed protein product [Paramecium tetraurelia]|eukprot:XP_001426978.1 hypothetical protein (macronuclear) [Paramecium tetraurelia strain d4-2]
MDNQISNRKCQQHDENVIATSLNLQCDEQNRYFCSKCLVLKINDRAIHTNTDAQERIITMKSEFELKTQNLTKQNIEVLKQFSENILALKNLLATTLDEINSTIENEIKRLQNVQKQIEENIKFIDIYNFDKIEEAQKLLEQQFSSFRTAINSQITKMESNLKMDSYLKYLDELKDEVQALIWYKSELEPSDENFIATPGLKIFCQKHKTEIIAFDLNPQRAKENRLACIYCIEQNTIPYTSLIRVIEKWKKYEELKKSKLLSIQQRHQENQSTIIQQLDLIHSTSQQKNEELTQSLKEFCNFIDGSVNKIIRSMGRNWANQSQKEILDNVDVLSKSIYNDEVILTEDNYYQKEENDINKLVSDSIEKIKETCLQCCLKIQSTIRVTNNLRDSITQQT